VCGTQVIATTKPSKGLLQKIKPPRLHTTEQLAYNTTSKVSHRTDRKRTLSIKQEPHRIQYRIPRSTKRCRETKRWWILYKTRAFYTSTGTTVQPIPHLDQTLTTEANFDTNQHSEAPLRNETPSEILIRKELCHVC